MNSNGLIYRLFAISLLLLIANVLNAQENRPQTAKGKITGPDNEPVRATVRTKRNGMALGNTNGEFIIQLKRLPDTLVFTAIGYIEIERVVKEAGEYMSLRMTPQIQQLGEVVVQTGYQTLKPNEINGSVSVVDERAINATTGPNILSRILNQSSGLLLNVGKTPANPQNNTNISIRGMGTIDGPLDPLIVLDGYIYEGDINNINPNDIENVSILKDASASSIWGARAGNGVIVITSKRGKLENGLQLSFSGNVLVETLPDLYAVSQMSAADYIDIERLLFDRGYFNNQITRTPFRALTPAVEAMLLQREGNITAQTAEAQLNWMKQQDSRKNYLDEFYTHAIRQQYGLNARGGSQRHSYFISGNVDKSIGRLYDTSNRMNLRLANDFKLNKKLTWSMMGSFTTFDATSGRPSYGALSTGGRTPTYLYFRDSGGRPVALDRNYRGAYTDTAARGKLLDWKFYPLSDYEQQQRRTHREELYASTSLKYRIVDYLQLEVGYQYQKQQIVQRNLANASSYAARDLVNMYSQFNYTTGIVKYIVPKGGILSNGFSDVASSTARVQLNLDKKIGVHALNAIVGAEARNVRSTSDGSVWHGYQDDPLTYGAVDMVNTYPEFLTKTNSQIGGGYTLQATHYRFLSFYGNMAYSFRGKYSVSASVRKDGSNIFGANINDRWKPLWSAGFGWAVSNENFYNFPALPTLSLKATYGHSGNVDLSKTALPIAGYGTNAATGLPYTRIITINNPELKWEQLSQLDLKLDFATKGKRLTGVVSYYIKHGTDLYGTAPFDYTTWGARSELMRNVAEMKGQGWDVELRGKILDGKFVWQTDLFFNRNESKTKDYYRSSGSDLQGLLNGANRISPIIGRPLYAIAAYKWAGLSANGDPQGYANGEISTNYTAIINEARATGNNLVFIGRATPLYFGAITNTFRWQEFSLGININYKLNYYFMKNSINYSSLVSNGASHADFAKRWQHSGDENHTQVPAFIYPVNANRDGFYSASEIHAERADHVRLSYVRLTYHFGVAKLGIGFRSLETFGALQNGGIIWKMNKAGLDPDYANQIPPTKEITFGIRGSF
ncbi:MAG: SusC/RagA family TonB-linked outer membrane protein [Sphingobacteriales bacterium]|nr:MAG: SusC/RagA family TonB-linked outer membrane protein [Sphingobacteriales bacterium]